MSRRTGTCSLVMVVALLGCLVHAVDLVAGDAAQEKLARPPLIPEPPAPGPVQPAGGASPAGRGASTPQASAGPVEELKGVKVVNFTSHYRVLSAAPSEIVSGDDPGKVWASSDGNFPQEFVLELPGEALISHIVFNNQAFEDAKRSSKDVEISVSTQHASFGFEVAAKAVLQQGAIGQGVELKPARQARWIKIRILSNYGSPDRTSLGMVQLLGRPSGK